MAEKDNTYPAIPEPEADIASLLQTVQILRQTVQTLVGARNLNTPSVVEQAKQANAKISRLEQTYTRGERQTAKLIERVEAESGGISADGKLRFIASAGPDGYYARYDLSLKAGSARSGFTVLARRNADGSVASEIQLTAAKIQVNASDFSFYDPSLGGQAKPVFAYFGGVFRFNVPVMVLGEEIENRGVTNSQLQINNSDNAADVRCTLVTRDGSQVDVFGLFDGQPTVPFGIQEAGVKGLQLVRQNADGSETFLRVLRVQFYLVRAADNVTYFFTQTMLMYRDMPPPGQNTYVLRMVNGTAQGPLTLQVIERHR